MIHQPLLSPQTVRRMWGWPAQDRRLLIEALRLALRVEFEMAFVPFTRVLRSLDALPSPRPKSKAQANVSTDALRRAIARAYRVLPFEFTCLRESLVLIRMMKRRSLTAELRMGVAKVGEQFSAHAWVEDDAGVVLANLAAPLDSFEPFPLPSTRRLPGKRPSALQNS